MRQLRLASGDACVEIAPDIGGAIASFRWRDDDVLRPASDEARAAGDVRGFASYPLVPHSNRIAESLLRTPDGATYVLARNLGDHPHRIHGVGWQRAWSVDEATPSHARLSFAHDPSGTGSEAWPFAFESAQSFTLLATPTRAALTMTLSIRNTDTRSFPFGLGWHPFFPREASTIVGFHAEAMWRVDETRLPTMLGPIPDEARFDPPRALAEVALDNVFTGWSGWARLDWSGSNRRTVVEADRSCGFLVVYVPPGRDFVALEPVTHMTDAFNRDARGERDTGTRYLEPGAARSCTMRIVATAADPA